MTEKFQNFIIKIGQELFPTFGCWCFLESLLREVFFWIRFEYSPHHSQLGN